MTADVEECFRKIIEKRNPPKAKSGMNPKALQYLMGHSDISVTLNTYTHVNLEDAREEVARIQVV